MQIEILQKHAPPQNIVFAHSEVSPIVIQEVFQQEMSSSKEQLVMTN